MEGQSDFVAKLAHVAGETDDIEFLSTSEKDACRYVIKTYIFYTN